MKRLNKYIVLLIILGLPISVLPGLSSFMEKYNETSVNDAGRDTSVTVKYYDKQYVWENISDSAYQVVSTNNIDGEKEGGNAENLYNTYNVNDIRNVSTVVEGNIEYRYFNICTYKNKENKYEFPWWYDFYTFYYEYRKQAIRQYELQTNLISEIQYLVKNNSTLNKNALKDGYIFFKDEEFTEIYDFSSNVSNNTIVYGLKVYDENNISKTISNTQGGVVNLYDSLLGGNKSSDGSGLSLDVSTDSAYYLSSLFLDECSLNTNTTLNLLLNSGTIGNNPEGALGSQDEYNANHNKTDETLNLSNNTKNLSLVLNGDLTINGTLIVGADTGNNGSSSSNSYINGCYTSIDLNGHNIYVNGQLKVFGEIKDTIGTGQIIVNENAEMYALMSYTDGRGGNQTIWGYGKGQTPFSDYRFPYITTKIRLNYNSSFTGYVKINLGSLGGSAVVFRLLGTIANSNSYIVWTGDNYDYIDILPYYITSLNSSTYTNNLYNMRVKVDVFADLKFLNVSSMASMKTGMAGIYLETDFPLYMSRINFPISTFFDINVLEDSNIEIPYLAVFYPGSSLYVGKDAKIVFSYINNYQYSELTVEKTFLGMGLKKTLPGSTKNLAGGILTFEKNFTYRNSYSHSSFSGGIYGISEYYNKYVSSSSVVIEGEIDFSSGANGKYILSGKIELNDNLISKIEDNKNMVQTYYSFDIQFGSTWFDTGSLTSHSNDKSVTVTTSFSVLPLISNNLAYIIDSNNNINGLYIDNMDAIVNGDTYYFLIGDDYLYGSNNSDQDSQISYNVNIVSSNNVDLTKKVFVDSNNNCYLYYAGTYVKAEGISYSGNQFVYTDKVGINLGKFISNEGNVTITDTSVSSFSSFKVIYDTNNNEWKKTTTIKVA